MTPPDVLRHADVADRLGRAFGVWRLRPDDPEQEALKVACARLADAVVPGITLGVHGATFLDGDGAAVGTRASGSLAEALYRLGIERLRLHRSPDPSDLVRFFAGVEHATDREDLHHRLGVVTGVLEPLSIAPSAARPDEIQEAEGWREVWHLLADPGQTADTLAGEDPLDAQGLIARMVALRDELPEEQRRSPEMAERLHAALLRLPDELRTAVARELTDTPDATFPGWFLSSLTDHELGSLLDGAASDVAGLAQQVLGRDLRELSAEVTIEPPPEPTAVADPDADDPPVRATAGEPLGLDSLEMFLTLETRPARLRSALLHWQRRIQDALHAGDLDAVHDLLGLSSRVVAVAEDDLTPAFDAACAGAFGGTEIEDLLPAVGEPLPDPTRDLLRAFGPVAVDAIMGRLIVEEDAQRRSQLVAILAALVPGNTGALGPWLEDQRWFVVRNVVTALWRAADPAARPLLERAAGHTEPRVRLEAARAFAALGEVDGLAGLSADPDGDVRRSTRRLLAGLGSAQAAAALADLALDDRVPLSDRRSALDALASHPRGQEHLRELADDHGLPLRLRWHAGRVTGGAA